MKTSTLFSLTPRKAWGLFLSQPSTPEPETPKHLRLFVRLLITALVVMALGLATESVAQVQDSTIYRVETKDGNEYLGRIVFDDPQKIKLITQNLGEITLNKTDIVKIETVQVSQIKDGVLWFNNPQASRHFWMPNGYGIKKGEGYYQNVWIFVNQFTVAASDHLSIGAGIVPTFLFGAPSPAWVTAKFSIPVKPDALNLGAGILAGTVLGDEGTGFGIAYGMSTFGTRDKNCTIGMGYGYSNYGWADRPTISFSALIRTSNRGYFITENYYIGTGEDPLVLISLGGRRIVKKVGIDFGLFMPIAPDITFIAIPWLGLTVPLVPKAK